MYLTLLIVVILTAIALVAVALGIANAISPRSFNAQKGEAYECGIPTRGKSWMQFKVGYYLFAILFLMFDVETVFLFPWAVVVQDLGVYGLVSILFFLVILVLGLAYAWRKGALEWKERNQSSNQFHMKISRIMSIWKIWSKNLTPMAPKYGWAVWTTLSTGEEATVCGHLPLLPAVVVSSLWRLEPHVMTLPVLGSK